MMKKIILFLTLTALLCGCQKITYISRDDQLSHLSEGHTTSAPDSTGTESSVADSSSDSTASSQTDSDTTVSESQGTTSTENTRGTDSTKSTTDTKGTESTNSTQSTTPSETNSTTITTTKPEETTVPETTEADSTEPPETTAAPDDPYDISNHVVGSTEYTVLAAMNEQRVAAGVPELSFDGYLCALASIRAYEVSQYWSHNRLDGSNWNTILTNYGYGYNTAAENLAQGSGNMGGYTVVSLWANSEGHMANMINPDFTHTGVGVYHYNGMTYVACLYTG